MILKLQWNVFHLPWYICHNKIVLAPPPSPPSLVISCYNCTHSDHLSLHLPSVLAITTAIMNLSNILRNLSKIPAALERNHSLANNWGQCLQGDVFRKFSASVTLEYWISSNYPVTELLHNNSFGQNVALNMKIISELIYNLNCPLLFYLPCRRYFEQRDSFGMKKGKLVTFYVF